MLLSKGTWEIDSETGAIGHGRLGIGERDNY